MRPADILIAGGGIGGLSLALTLHQIGVSCVVCESSRQMKPLGVGINLQPNAVRELLDLGFSRESFDGFGRAIEEWTLVGRQGSEIYAELRGEAAGYHWPQYAVHRGAFHMALYERFRTLAGDKAILLDHKFIEYRQNYDRVEAVFETAEGKKTLSANLLVGADGIHSAVRAQMHPTQPPIHWGGALMWRGTSWARPLRSGASFVGLGGPDQRMVIYPISHPDPKTGLALINWIAEIQHDDPASFDTSSWFRQVAANIPLKTFKGWTFDWLNVPDLISAAGAVFENPMIDRDPVSTWIDNRVALLGDAAHAMYPTGSNGASQAIIDARILGAKLLQLGISPDALEAYNDELHGPISDLVLRNRQAGPFGLLSLVHDRCGGVFDDIDKVVSPSERSEFMAKYKSAAGFAKEVLNAAAPTIPQGARIG
ncbi:2-polyprenyl-6-methoxyphenol hydroxylase-like FAD-dependent oxidoreductase [Shimia isoporae]|uniref:2-polyprenyl-6-methoxyphenol hydroxylase-like FAD-dependent oxidoreductase n=1 Tax=Shimia isoporae TaxID=647720 RepID=A0A4R1NPH8_9RHOB|nr:flavin-dependent oxidoreductase [Shimia isoporae]TCL10274.1 2-polyprenyl-6-methoxyphenol hydroxylase-like FAD-dependent oxidoreductase [Shimia isoporae]